MTSFSGTAEKYLDTIRNKIGVVLYVQSKFKISLSQVYFLEPLSDKQTYVNIAVEKSTALITSP